MTEAGTVSSSFTPDLGGPRPAPPPPAPSTSSSSTAPATPPCAPSTGVSVDLFRGEFTAIMGPSGSGKSTLMHCLAGLDAVTSGSVSIGDIELAGLSDKKMTALRRDRIGFVFQSFNLVPTLTAIENITLPHRHRRTQARRRLAGHRHRPRSALATDCSTGPARLSGGQQQRVACARALAVPAGDHLRRRADRQPRLPLQR